VGRGEHAHGFGGELSQLVRVGGNEKEQHVQERKHEHCARGELMKPHRAVDAGAPRQCLIAAGAHELQKQQSERENTRRDGGFAQHARARVVLPGDEDKRQQASQDISHEQPDRMDPSVHTDHSGNACSPCPRP